MNQNWLYIGDVIKDVQFPNLLNVEFDIKHVSNKNKYMAYKNADKKFFVYLSHECAFHEGKANSYLLVPLQNVPKNFNIEKLKESNNVKKSANHLHLFCYEKQIGIFNEHMVIDFHRLFHVGKRSRAELLSNKVYELPITERMLLKNKLGYYFSHVADEEPG